MQTQLNESILPHSHTTVITDEQIKRYLPLVDYHVQKMAQTVPANVNKDDLKGYALMGLYNALGKFEEERGLKFETYASHRIKGAILDGLRKEDWLSRGSRDRVKKIEKTSQELQQSLMRKITTKEIAQELGVKEDDVVKAQNDSLAANVVSIDQATKDDDELLKGNNLIDTIFLTPEQSVLQKEMHVILTKMISELTENEQMVISLFYKEELTITEIAEILSLSKSRISQIHIRSLKKMKERILEYEML